MMYLVAVKSYQTWRSTLMQHDATFFIPENLKKDVVISGTLVGEDDVLRQLNGMRPRIFLS